MGPMQSGDERGGSVAQARRRCQEKLKMEEHVPKTLYINTRRLGVVCVHSEMSRVHVVAQGDGEASARIQKTVEGRLKRSGEAL